VIRLNLAAAGMDSAKLGRDSANYRGYSAKLGRDSAKLQKDTAEFAYDSANPLLVTFFNRGTSPFTVCLAAGARIMNSANLGRDSANYRSYSAKLGRNSAKTSEGFRQPPFEY
jgi:hypothetical protein